MFTEMNAPEGAYLVASWRGARDCLSGSLTFLTLLFWRGREFELNALSSIDPSSHLGSLWTETLDKTLNFDLSKA